MGKIWVEVCLISARGLRRSSSFWKLQWFAVGWIDSNNKYCTKIDACGNSNPVWRTKFAALVDDSNFQDMMLQVEVYSREPIFLRERLQGTATVVLKEFAAKHGNHSAASAEQVGSYQLRKRNSNKPQGFIDISIRISEEREEPSSYPGNDGLFILDRNKNIASSTGYAFGNGTHLPHDFQSQANTPFSNYHLNSSAGEPSFPSTSGPGNRPPPPPPPPPPPSNVGYIPTFLPRTDETYLNMPSSGPERGPRPGFGMGVVGVGAGAGAGALAAGAVIFGDDFMLGFDVPAGTDAGLGLGFQDESLTISVDPPFS